jgi:23S rRNA pseudouridine2605 synthase
VRLHRFIAQCGLTSRRKAEDLIREGRVTVNGQVVTEMGVTVGPEDSVEVDGELLAPPRRQVFLLNKPKGAITTLSDPHGRLTIVKFLPSNAVGVKPVGRLDKDTDGVIVLTNDGSLASRLTHPRYGVEKEYEATVQGLVSDRDLQRLATGVWIPGGKTAPARVERLGYSEKDGTTRLRLVLHEGRNRQVRLMAESIGHPVVSLTRVRFAFLRKRGLRPGECRALSQEETSRLERLVGLRA